MNRPKGQKTCPEDAIALITVRLQTKVISKMLCNENHGLHAPRRSTQARRQTAKVVTEAHYITVCPGDGDSKDRGERKKRKFRKTHHTTRKKEWQVDWMEREKRYLPEEKKTTKSCFVVFINIYEWKRARNIKRLIKFPATERQPRHRGHANGQDGDGDTSAPRGVHSLSHTHK